MNYWGTRFYSNVFVASETQHQVFNSNFLHGLMYLSFACDLSLEVGTSNPM